MSEYIVQIDEGMKVDTVLVDGLPEVVRCRDCKYGVDESLWCKQFASYGDLPTVQPDGFCAWGERRD